MAAKWKTAAFVLPSLFGFMLFYIIPAGFSLKYAFSGHPITGGFAGFNNFIRILESDSFRLAMGNTLKFIAVSLPFNMALPLALAVMVEGLDHRRWLTTVFMSPLVIPSACIAFLFRSFFSGNGLLSFFTRETVNWLETDFSFAIAVLIYIWKNIGYNLVLYIAGLAAIPADYREWAAVEGMGGFRYFFSIKLRYLMPSLFIVFVMSFINTFKVYRELYMLAGDYPHEKIYMLQHYMNNQFHRLNYANLTAASFLVIGAVSLAVILFLIADQRSGG